MSDPQLFVCGGLPEQNVSRRFAKGATTHTLATGSGRNSIRLNVDHLITRLSSSLPDHLADLLEIAAYVYIADQILTRGGTHEFDYGERWRRQIRLAIPVRCPERWNRPEVRNELEKQIGELTQKLGAGK